jgi:hypothetical protein
VAAVGTARQRVDKSRLGDDLRGEQDGEQPEIRGHGTERDIHPAPDEEERCEEGECDDAGALLFLTVLLVVAAHGEAEDEGGQDGVAVRRGIPT